MGRWRRFLPWLLAATVLWLVAAACDRRTEVVIENLGGHLRFSVAGTEIVVPETIRSVEEITLWTTDSIDPARVVAWSLSSAGEFEDLPAPGRGPRLGGAPVPVGDWWVDERCEPRILARHGVDLEGSFELRLSLRGRFTNDLTLGLQGSPRSFSASDAACSTTIW